MLSSFAPLEDVMGRYIKLSSSKHKPRLPRKGTVASEHGVMGAEFISVVAAIDDKGYSISKALSYGVSNAELFDENFTKHFRSPSYICTDKKYDYITYCQMKGFNHYIIPSNYMKTLEENGYLKKAEYKTTDPTKIEKIKAKNKQILERLYKEELIDFIYPQRLTFWIVNTFSDH